MIQIGYFTFHQGDRWEQGSVCDSENVLFISMISVLWSKTFLLDIVLCVLPEIALPDSVWQWL